MENGLIVKFSDGELIQNPSWNSMPNKPIQRIKYLFNGKTIIMEGYEEYNHLKEVIYSVLGNNSMVRNIYLMGKTKNYSQVIILNLLTGTIQGYQSEINKEYGGKENGRPSTGWKKGNPTLNPQYKIL